MNIQPDLNRITTTQVNRLKNDDNTIGVLLFGSAAHASLDEFSDVDMYCITKAVPHLSRESLYDAVANVTIEILYGGIDELGQYIEQERRSVYRTVSSILASGKMLYAADDTIARLIKDADLTINSRTELTEIQSIMIRYSLEDFYSDAQREHLAGRHVEFLMYADKLIQNALEASLRFNGGYFEPPRKLMSRIQKTDKELYELISQYAVANFEDQLSELQKISEYATSLLGGSLPKAWDIAKS